MVEQEDYYFPVNLQEVYDNHADGETYVFNGTFMTAHPSYYEGGRTLHNVDLLLTPNKGPFDWKHIYIEIDLNGKKIFPTASSYIYLEPIEKAVTEETYAVITYISTRYPEDYVENYTNSLGDATAITDVTSNITNWRELAESSYSPILVCSNSHHPDDPEYIFFDEIYNQYSKGMLGIFHSQGSYYYNGKSAKSRFIFSLVTDTEMVVTCQILSMADGRTILASEEKMVLLSDALSVGSSKELPLIFNI